jgi:hypothetical protein
VEVDVHGVVDGMEVLLIRAGTVQDGPLDTVEVDIPLDALPRNEKIRGDGVAGLAQILRVEEGEIVTGRLPGPGQGGEGRRIDESGQHRYRSSVGRGVDVFYLIDGVLDDAVEAGIALGIFAGQKAEGSTLLRDCPDSIRRLAVDDVLRGKGRSGAVVAHGLDELGILLGIGLAALLGTANVVQRDVQVADAFGVEIRFELVKLMAVMDGLDGLLKADGDEQAEDDGGDMDKEVSPGAGSVVGGVDVEHALTSGVCGYHPTSQSFGKLRTRCWHPVYWGIAG